MLTEVKEMWLNPPYKAATLAAAILLATVAAVSAQALPGCTSKCGEVEVPYPFGIGSQPGTDRSCSLDNWFNLTCENSTLKSGNVEITSISLEGQLDISMIISKICYNQTGGVIADVNSILTSPVFTVSSTENKFVSVGCDTYGYLFSRKANQTDATGCLTKCEKIPSVENTGNCSGIGCCQVDIPVGMRNITVDAYSFNKQQSVWDFNNCSYSFVAKHGWFNFSTDDLRNLRFDKAPVVLDWTVGNSTCDDLSTCEVAKRSSDYVCQYDNSYCQDSGNGFGYRCKCKAGFEGNPYHPEGCKDKDECKTTSTNNCISENNCRNTIGSYECYCPSGYHGNGTKDGGCQSQKSEWQVKVIIGSSAGFIALFIGMSCLYLVQQKRKLVKVKERFFRQNGGFILQQQLSTRDQNSSRAAKIFTLEDLKKATNNYDESLIIGKGGYGTVFKGTLADNTVVAIKKSKVADQSQIEQFINEVVVLSQINHRNVVKLLGCCLETEVPLLVYEFVNNGTLFDYIHKAKKDSSDVSFENRLRIAVESAGALSYLHSAASIPIIHRDVKTTNILLDETYTAKVSDFGASRLIPVDQTELATMVQGTLGYLDPEYMQTSQLTEKSDVYSFGVVLAELLTGRKALSFDRPEEERSLAMHFLSRFKEDRLYDVLENGVVNERNEEKVEEVALLAARCLRLRGDERPCMKEVALELERIRMTEKHPWANKDADTEETQYLLHETSRFGGDSSNNSHTVPEYDSMAHHVLVDFDRGR